MSNTGEFGRSADDMDMFEPNRATVTALGRLDQKLCRIGVGGGNGMPSSVLEYAISRGINYVFYSSDLHNGSYSNSEHALRRYVRRGARLRDKVFLAAASYVCDAEKILGVVSDQLYALGVDHVDLFHWGWVTRANAPINLIERTAEIVRSHEGRAYIDDFIQTTRQVRDELRSRGYARFLGISTHDRHIAAELAKHPLVDVVMFRYNIAHRGAESEVFNSLPVSRPGTVAFNTSHEQQRSLSEPPAGLPPGKYKPTQGDLYRYVLDRPEVDIVLTGPQTREHIDEALAALEAAPQEPRLRDYLNKYGALQSGKVMVAK